MIYNDKLPCTFVICMCYQKLVLPWARTSYTTAITVPLQAAICSWFALCDGNLSNFLLKLVMFHLVTGNFTCLKLTPVVDFANSTSCTSTNLLTFVTPHHSAMWAFWLLHKNVHIPCKSSYLKIASFHISSFCWCFVRNPAFAHQLRQVGSLNILPLLTTSG